MAQQREVLIKLKTVDEGSAKAINLISTALKNLQREIAKPVGDSTDKTASYKSASYNSALKDISKIRNENLRAEKAIAAEITRSDTITANNKVKEARRAANGVISSLNQIERESKQAASGSTSIFSSVLGGSFFGTLGAKAVSAFTSAISGLPGIVAELFTKSADFSQATVSLAQFSGSIGAAQEKILELTQVAAQTPGLSFLSAIDGQKRLQAVGFEADKATQILVGLAKVRLLSGSTKEDFNAVVLNLTQIATGGQKVGQEIRELIGRMPALGAVIRKEFGTLSGEVLNKIDPKEFVSRIAAATSAMNVEFASSSQAAENLGDSIDRIKIVVGSIIEQNPEVIALLRLWAGEIDEVTGSLANQDSQQRSTFSSFISGLATGLISIENYTDRASANFKIFTNTLSTSLKNAGEIFGTLVNAFFEAVKVVAYGATAAVASVIDVMVNGIQKSINAVVSSVNSVTFNLPGIPQLPQIETISNFADEMRKATVDSWERGIIASGLFFKTLESNSNRRTQTQLANQKLVDDAEIKSYNRTRIFNNLVERERKAVEKRKSQTFERDTGKGGSVTTGKDGGKSSGKARGGTSKNVFDEIEDIGKEQGFIATSKFRKSGPNGPTDHAGRGAADFGFNTNFGKTVADWTRLVVAGLEKGKQVIDERIVGYHPGIKGGQNVHLGNNPKPSLFLPQKFYSVPVGYLKELDAKRRSKRPGVVDESEIERYKTNQSDEKTKAERNRQTLALVAAANQTRILPDKDVIRDYNAILVETAKKTDALQESIEETGARFKGFSELPNLQDKDAITERKIIPTDTAFFEPKKAQVALDERRLNFSKELLANTVAYGISLQNTQLDLQAETDLLSLRNILFETANQLTTEQNQQTREIGDAEVALGVLRAQNADKQFTAQRVLLSAKTEQLALEKNITDLETATAVFRQQNADNQFVEQRRLLTAKTEQLSIEKEIANLQDRLSNGGVNDGLEIQAAHLRDVLDLRRRELDAVISINRSQLELANSQVISNNQIRAQVFEHLAQQKTLNQSIADGIISIYDSAANSIDKMLDKSVGKIPILGNIIKAQSRNLLSKVTGSLLDKFLPPDLAAAAKSTGNPVVDKLTESNQYLKKIADGGGGVANFNIQGAAGAGQSVSGGGGGIGGILGTVLKALGLGGSGGGGGGQGAGGTPNFNSNQSAFAGFGSGSGSNLAGAPRGNPLAELAAGLGKSSGGSGSSILGKGGIFGKEGFGNNVGTYGAIGGFAGIAGGLIGGTAGGVISGAGSGLALGAQIGSIIPGVGTAIGAGIGAVVGAIAGFFSARSARKKEQKQSAQFLQESFKGLEGYDQLIKDVRNLRIDGASAISQGESLGSNIRTQYITAATALKDKKTRNIALKDVSKIDAVIAQKMEELRKAADVSNAAKLRADRIVPEFAQGGYFADYFKPNGLLPGRFDGRDDILAKISRGEMILNPTQIQSVIARAGHDVFAGVVPNYPKAQSGQKFATGGRVTGTQVAPVVKVELHNVNTTPDSRMVLHTDDGKKQVVNIVREARKNREI